MVWILLACFKGGWPCVTDIREQGTAVWSYECIHDKDVLPGMKLFAGSNDPEMDIVLVNPSTVINEANNVVLFNFITDLFNLHDVYKPSFITDIGQIILLWFVATQIR